MLIMAGSDTFDDKVISFAFVTATAYEFQHKRNGKLPQNWILVLDNQESTVDVLLLQ